MAQWPGAPWANAQCSSRAHALYARVLDRELKDVISVVQTKDRNYKKKQEWLEALNSRWEPSVSWPGADFSVLIVGGVG